MQTQELEAIIQRHAAGDRDPGLLAFLDAAAWESFHDPWEVRPAAAVPGPPASRAADPVPPPAVPAPPVPAPAVLLAAFLEARRWPFIQDGPHQFRCSPPCLGMEGPDLTLDLSLDRRRRTLDFRLASAWTVPEESRRDAWGFCDKWKQAGRTLGARLEMPLSSPGQPRPREGSLVLEHPFELPPRLTMKALVAHLDLCLAEAADFWFMTRAWAEGWGRE